jgi:hypothetical protein
MAQGELRRRWIDPELYPERLPCSEGAGKFSGQFLPGKESFRVFLDDLKLSLHFLGDIHGSSLHHHCGDHPIAGIHLDEPHPPRVAGESAHLGDFEADDLA